MITSREGLPQNSVMGMAFDAEGRLWVATQDGTASFDGRAWRAESVPDPALSNFLRCALATSEGLWFGRQDGGVARRSPQGWASLPVAPMAQRINAMAVQDGVVYAASDAAGLWRFDGKAWQAVPGLPSPRLQALAASPEGLWVGGAGPLACVDAKGRVTTVETVHAITALLVGRDTLWAAGQGHLHRRVEGRWTEVALPPSFKGLTPSSLAETEEPDGRRLLWVGSDNGGLACLDRGAWRLYGAAEGLASASIWSLLPSPGSGATETLWIGTDAGLARLQFGQWQSFGRAQGLPDSVYGMALPEAPALAGLWLGTRTGLWRLREGRAERQGPTQGWTGEGTFALREWREDGVARLYSGQQGGSLQVFDGTRWRSVPHPAALDHVNARRLEVAKDGGLWLISGQSGLWHLQHGQWRKVEGLPTEHLHALLESSEGSLWVGTEGGGLVRMRGGRVQVHDTRNGLPNNTVMSLCETRWQDRPRLWVGTEGAGLLWSELGEGDPVWHLVSDRTDPALPNNTVYQLQADAEGRVYAFTNRGVARLSDAAGRLRMETFTAESGLPSQEFNGGSSMVDAAGRVWGGCVAGAVVFDPAQERHGGARPRLLLGTLQVDGAARPLAPGGTLGYRERDLRFEFGLLSLFRGEETQYRTQLMGLEPTPHPWSAEAYREYPGLTPGAYTFRVWARDYLGRVQGPADFRFELPAPPWKRPWAYALYALATAALVAVGVRARLRALKHRTEELEAQVRARTAEIEAQKGQIEEQNRRIAGLMQSATSAQEDLLGWARRIAKEVATAIGAEDLGVFMVQGDDLKALGESGARMPTLQELRRAWVDPSHDRRRKEQPVVQDRRRERVVAVKGAGGDVLGGLVVKGSTSQGDPERQLLEAFASQLGAVLELHRTRQTLQAARARQDLSRRALREKGVALLQTCPTCGRCFDETVQVCPEDGAGLESNRVLPHVLEGRYRLDRLLGEGGMGLVFAARDQRLGREVALKLLKPELYAHAQIRARFQQEAKALAALDHPGLVAIHDSGELEDGSAFLVMELLRGATLGAMLQRFGAGTPRQVAALLRQSATALGAAHEAGILHRDIKPENLFLLPDPGGFRTKVLDFGLAKPLGADAGVTHTGMVVGTPHYMSPEQVRARPLDFRSDLYSLAATIYEALSGRKLIRTEFVVDVFAAIASGQHPALGSLVPGLPAEAVEAIEKALAVDPEARPRDLRIWALAVAQALEQAPDRLAGWPSIPVEGFQGQAVPTGAEPTAAKPAAQAKGK
jgi:ligand-binding sensor domain-containing protein/tRNA A-37 threonylcarbamoyl transferase component Bud32